MNASGIKMIHRNWPVRYWLIIGFLLVTTQCIPRPLHAQASGSSEDPAVLAARLLQAVNDTRAAHGIPPLQTHSLLTVAATKHVDDMARNHLYSHTGSDGSSVRMRTEQTGYSSPNGVSENWVSTRSVEGAINWWMNSYVHQRNLLNPKWDEGGVGVARDPNNGLLLFVLVFGGDGQVVPVVSSNVTASNIQAPVASAPDLPVGTPYIVQPGDTLLAIALRYGLTWQEIAAHNGLNERSVLQIGQSIRLPYEPESQAAAIGGASEGSQGYTVRTGDTLATIGAQFGVPWQDLAAVNSLSSSDVLHIGQSLRIPVVATTPEITAPQQQTHTVQAGETIITVALQYNLNWQELLRINGLGENSMLSIGQEIRLN